MELNWTKYSVLCNQNQISIFQITKGELYIPVVTLNTENNNKLSELLSKGFEITVVWNECKSKIERVTIPQYDNMFRRTTLDTSFQDERTVVWNECKSKIERVTIPQYDNMFRRTTLDTSFQGVSKLFGAAYETDDIERNANTEESRRKYYLPRAEVKDYNVLINGRNCYDQNVNSRIVRYNELLKMATGRSEDYSTGCLDYDYYIKDFNIVGIDLSHQTVLDSDPKISQHIDFVYKLPSGNATINYDLLTAKKMK